MVHRRFGTARITYPTGVKVSPADPMTSANLPRELRLVPGVVSRPIRIGAVVSLRVSPGYRLPPTRPGAPTANQLIQQFLAQAGGDPLLAFGAASDARRSDPQNRTLRNAEHALFSNYLKHWLGPGFGHAAVAVTPAYSVLKAIGQPLGFFKRATPPSWREVQYGLRPLFGPVATTVEPVAPAPAPEPVAVEPALRITGYVTVGSWPGSVSATLEQCMEEIRTHGGSGCQAVYSDGTTGPVIAYTAPTLGAHHAYRLGYYPNLGQDAWTMPSDWPAGLASIPTWVWWAGGAGVVVLLLGGVFFRGTARRRPSVRTVTRTTY